MNKLKFLIFQITIIKIFSYKNIENIKNENWTCKEGCNTTIEYCYENLTCPYCKEKYYGEECEKNCIEKCKICDKKEGNCEICENGFYGENCEKNCSKNCKNDFCEKKSGKCECKNITFDEEKNCEECIFNFTGINCDKNCNFNCDLSDKINCDKDGKCNKCKLNFYSNDCSLKCNENCLINSTENNCNKENGECKICKDGFYGKFCEKKCEENCVECNKENGICIKCNETYYLNDTKHCNKCSDNCTNNTCIENGICISCSNYNNYGNFCNLTCPIHCNKSIENEYFCDKITGDCNFGCEKNYEQSKCNICVNGYYFDEDNITCIKCSDNCEIIDEICDKKNGYCKNCKNGFWHDKCEYECSNYCKDNKCDRTNGKCINCIDSYYLDNDKICQKCPENCINKCSLESGCEICEFNYGKWCNLTCPNNCFGNICDRNNGECFKCKDNFYGVNCTENCSNCNNSCFKKNGECIQHLCKNNFYGLKCEKECDKNCINGCDLYNGFCINCNNKSNFGEKCENICDKDCFDKNIDEDDRIECCYVKNNTIEKKNFSVIIENYKNESFYYRNKKYKNYEKNEFDDFENYFLNLSFGSMKKEINILIDFNSNSPLVLFDENTKFENEEDEKKIEIGKIKNSNESLNYTNNTETIINEAKFSILETKGIPSKDIFTYNLNGKEIIFNSYFLISTIINKVEDNIDLSKKIEGIVGLGFLSLFSESLFLNKKISRNIFTKINNTIIFGDFSNNIKNKFSKTTTLIPKKENILFNDKIELKTDLIGFAVSKKKAYKYELNSITLSLTKNTEIILNNTYQIFFEKIYFGSLIGKGCSINVVFDKKIFQCDNKELLNKLPKFGIVIDNYIYYLSHNFLFKYIDNKFRFIIKLGMKINQNVILGKEFFKEFEVVFNNGNNSLNFFGDVNKLSIKVIDLPKDLTDNNIQFSPGLFIIIITSCIVSLIIFCYCVKNCCNNNFNLEDDVGSFLAND